MELQETGSVIDFLEENVRIRFEVAIENNCGLRDIAEKTKVAMKQISDNYTSVLTEKYNMVFRNF